MRTAQAAGPNCDVVLEACDAGLRAKQRELDLADLGIKIRDEDRVRLQTENAQLQGQSGAWYNNPYFQFVLGAVVGGYLVSRATR